MTQIFVKPGPGCTVKVPGLPKHRNTVPPEGWLMEHDHFVERRLAAGDLVRAEAPAPAKAERGAA